MSTATDKLNRNEILSEIAEHQLRITELQGLLSQTTVFKSFWHFRCEPERHVLVYASTREQANERLQKRMNSSYGPKGWKLAIKTVQVLDNPQQACTTAPDNLLRCLSEAEALEFLQDWEENQKGRADKPKLKDVPLSQLEKDIKSYRIWLRKKQEG